jgi:hypothetical protein
MFIERTYRLKPRQSHPLELILVLNKPLAGLPNGKPDNAADILLAGACFALGSKPTLVLGFDDICVA